MDRQHRYEVARYQAVSIINLTSTVLKKQITDARELTRFPWEEKVVAQSPDQIKHAVMAIASRYGAVCRVKEDPNGPPLHLAAKYLK